METTNTSLRQSENVLQIEGILSEKNLTKMASPNDQRITIIRGSMVFKISDTNFITVDIYEPSHYADQQSGVLNPNKAFEGINTIISTYKSISEVGEESATKVRFRRGSIQPRTYIQEASKERRTAISYRNRYFSQVTGAFEPQATFAIEGYIWKMREEFVGSDATGRLIVELLVSDYKGGVEPLTIYVPAELASAFSSEYSVQQTLMIYGEIVSKAAVSQNKVDVAFGVSKNKTGPDRRAELVLTGASAAYDDERAFDPATVQAALVERESRLERELASAGTHNNVSSAASSTDSMRRAPYTRW